MPVQKLVTSEKHNITGTTYVGEKDRVFFDVTTKTFRLSDGSTPGGIVISQGGGGGSLTGITDSTTGPVMTLTDVNVSIENSLTLESDQGLAPVKSTEFILYGQTLDHIQKEIYRDASNTRITLQTQTTYFYDVDVVGRNNTTNKYASFKFQGTIDYNQAGNVVHLVNQKETFTSNSDQTYDASVGIDNTAKAITVQVTGDVDHEMKWVARVKLTQVTLS